MAVASPLRLTLPYPPSANRYWRTTARGGRVLTYLSEEARAYRAHVLRLGRALGVTPTSADVELRLVVYRPRRAGDLSNRVKVLEDALIGVAYADDSQVVRIVAERLDDAASPRVEVEVREVAE